MAEVFAAPARYAQGPGVAATLGDEMTRLGLGGPVLVLAGASAVRQLGAIWEESLGRGGFAPAIHPFGGECSRREIAAVAAELDLDIISYPTIASTDAPTSAISVV